jgi:pSer/pThr/pTyr-binding forkhead associated (FHA) protein
MKPSRKTLALNKHLAWIVPQHGPLEGQVFPIEDGHGIGTGRDAKILVMSEGVAPLHATFAFESDRWVLRDLGTGKVTTVSDRAVKPNATSALGDGEPIVLGSLRVIFKCL